MRKTDKKLEKQLIKVLNEACNDALAQFQGFKWLTHSVRYSDFPASLSIICVFDTDENLELLYRVGGNAEFLDLIAQKLGLLPFTLQDVDRHVLFDTEETCHRENNGRWSERLR
ncbi:Fis family transcriptional regulator [Agaribacterium sp. ZY112]|uniref:Fis family transcriptional regulator n=1 Tax=Agaribacterium sp. ZY112 TaxID=3233574 RepID=UPI0035263284